MTHRLVFSLSQTPFALDPSSAKAGAEVVQAPCGRGSHPRPQSQGQRSRAGSLSHSGMTFSSVTSLSRARAEPPHCPQVRSRSHPPEGQNCGSRRDGHEFNEQAGVSAHVGRRPASGHLESSARKEGRPRAGRRTTAGSWGGQRHEDAGTALLPVPTADRRGSARGCVLRLGRVRCTQQVRRWRSDTGAAPCLCAEGYTEPQRIRKGSRRKHFHHWAESIFVFV